MIFTDQDLARDALAFIDPSTDRDTWLQVGMSAHAAGLSLDDFDQWSAAGDGYNAADVRAVWRSFKSGGVGPGTLFYHAKLSGWTDPRTADQRREPVRATRPANDDRAPAADRARAAERARWIWEQGQPANDNHPYIRAKGISAEGLRVDRAGNLIVPLFDARTRELMSVERIDQDGAKRALKDAQKQGCFFELPGDGAPIFAEGLATGWTVRAATGRRVVVTFSAGNLPGVAALLAEPGSCVAADNNNQEKPGALMGRKVRTYGTGHRKALETGLPFYMPPIPGADFNDLGTEQTREIFSRDPVSTVPVFDPWALKPANLGTATDQQLAKRLNTAEDPEQAACLAVAVADRLSVRVPAQMSVIEVRAFVETHLPANAAHPVTLDRIAERLEWFQSKREAAALAAVSIPDEISARHDYQRVRELPQLGPDEYRGVIVVRAGTGAGKTQDIGRPFMNWAKDQDAAALAICHRVSLVSELSNRLELRHYKDVFRDLVPFTHALATCLPSITQPDHLPIIERAGYVFIDEVSQVLRFLDSKDFCKTGAASNQGVYERLCQIVKQARCLIVADAGVDRRTIEFLEHCRPGERFRIIDMATKPSEIRAEYRTGRAAAPAVVGDCLAELAAGGKVWIAVESRERSQALGLLFESYGYRAMAVHASNKGNRAQREFLENVEAESRLYDVVIASPTISSGVSVEHKGRPHFTLGAFIGSGTRITPADAVQMLRRVRYLERYTLGLLPNSEIGNQSSAALMEAWETASRIEGTQTSITGFDALRADIQTAEANQRSDFAAGLLWLLKANRWKLSRAADAGTDGLEVEIKTLRDHLKNTQREALKAARVIDDDEAQRLERLTDRTEQQNVILEAYRIRRVLNVPAVTDEVLEFWDEGRAVRRMDRFDAARGIVPAFDDSHETLSRRRYWKACARAYGYLFEGIDLASDWWLNEWSANLILDRILERRHLLAHLGIVGRRFAEWRTDKDGKVKPMTRPDRPVKVVAEILDRMGLRLESKQTRNVHTTPLNALSNYTGSVYTGPDRPAPKRGRVYKVTAESLEAMQEWSDRRNLARKVTEAFQFKPLRPIVGRLMERIERERVHYLGSFAVGRPAGGQVAHSFSCG